MKDSALTLKRQIETAVLRAHPDWGGSRVGEDGKRVRAMSHIYVKLFRYTVYMLYNRRIHSKCSINYYYNMIY